MLCVWVIVVFSFLVGLCSFHVILLLLIVVAVGVDVGLSMGGCFQHIASAASSQPREL